MPWAAILWPWVSIANHSSCLEVKIHSFFSLTVTIERYLSIDSKMKGSPLSLEEVMSAIIVLFFFFVLNHCLFCPCLDDFDDHLLVNLLPLEPPIVKRDQG